MPYGDAIKASVRRLRKAKDLRQAQLAKRMQSLGYPWHPQTVTNVETGDRRVVAEELLGLALSLEVGISDLMTPDARSARQQVVSLPFGGALPASSVASMTGRGFLESWIVWRDDEPVWPTLELVRAVARLEQEAEAAFWATQSAERDVAEAMAYGRDASREVAALEAARARVQALRTEIQRLRSTPESVAGERAMVEEQAVQPMIQILSQLEGLNLTPEQLATAAQAARDSIGQDMADAAVREANEIVNESKRADADAAADQRRGKDQR